MPTRTIRSILSPPVIIPWFPASPGSVRWTGNCFTTREPLPSLYLRVTGLDPSLRDELEVAFRLGNDAGGNGDAGRRQLRHQRHHARGEVLQEADLRRRLRVRSASFGGR